MIPKIISTYRNEYIRGKPEKLIEGSTKRLIILPAGPEERLFRILWRSASLTGPDEDDTSLTSVDTFGTTKFPAL